MPIQEQRVNPKNDAITAMGEIFDDGTIIEQVGGNQLLISTGGNWQIVPSVNYHGLRYVPAALDSQLSRTLRLPGQPAPYESVERLISDTRGLFRGCGVDGDWSLPLSITPLVTWVPESLRHPLLVNFWGPYGAATGIMDVITCIARRALRLADASVSSLASVPRGLNPTLVMLYPSEHTLERLVLAAGEPDTYFG